MPDGISSKARPVLSGALGWVEILIWALFSLSPFLMVGGYLLYHTQEPAPSAAQPTAKRLRTDAIVPNSGPERKSVVYGQPRNSDEVRSSDERAWNDYQSKLQQLKYGMNLEQVKAILGYSSSVLISGRTSLGPRETREWELRGGFKVTVTFHNGLVEEFSGRD